VHDVSGDESLMSHESWHVPQVKEGQGASRPGGLEEGMVVTVEPGMYV
jgi:Xaa-Pro aminopeptidase